VTDGPPRPSLRSATSPKGRGKGVFEERRLGGRPRGSPLRNDANLRKTGGHRGPPLRDHMKPRLPLGEAVERSETDEGNGIDNRAVLTEHDAALPTLPSSAPVCALGHLPPGEDFFYGLPLGNSVEMVCSSASSRAWAALRRLAASPNQPLLAAMRACCSSF